MEPNETYWDQARKPTVRIVYDNAISREDALKAVATGDGNIDVVLDLTTAEAKAFDGGGHAKVQSKQAKTVLAGVFNRAKPNAPWNDPALRRALNQAIDRSMVIDKGANGWGVPMPALIQPGRYGADPSMQPYTLDLEAARRVIEAADIPGREVLLLASPDWSGVVEVITECLAKVGLTVRADYSKTEPEGWDLKLVWHFDWSPQYPVGVVHREFFGRSGGFLCGPPDEMFEGLYDKLLKTPHQPAQEAVVREIERYVFDEAKALFLFSPFNLFAVSERVDFVAYDTCMSELAETRIRSAPS